MQEPSTPLMRQYSGIKQKHPQALLFFRLGDFYEMFFEDAVVAARELQITLTSRNKEKGEPVPMCGVPHHAAEAYIARLIQKGYKVAVCEQMEDPRLAKKLVRREVTRVITPGTAAGLPTLSERENNFLVAVCRSEQCAGLACVDLSTGEFRATEIAGPDWESRLAEEVEHLGAREMVFPAGSPPLQKAGGRLPFGSADGAPNRVANTPLDEWVFGHDHAWRLLTGHFGVHSLDGFGFAEKKQAVGAAGALLHYLQETQRGTLAHLDRIQFYERQQWMVLDSVTVRNLELTEPLFSGDSQATLISVLDRTATAMGGRLLRSWMLRPSLDRAVIEARLEAVAELHAQPIVLTRVAGELASIYDLERLLSKVTLNTATPRDLAALRNSLVPLPALRSLLAGLHSQRWTELREEMDELPEVRSLLGEAVVDSPPLNWSEGGYIREGYSAELDELRRLSQSGKQTIAAMEARERSLTGIQSLKIKYNEVFGYYMEVSNPNLPLVPDRFERKQTLVNAERFTTPELKEYERKVLDAEQRMQEIEQRLFLEVRSAVGEHASRIRRTAAGVGEADVLANFARLAGENHYCRPQFSDEGVFEIVAGRHPVLERLAELQAGDRFVPNDLYMNSAAERILIITGPNMGGKSTYLRQVALIAILAQMGSFVPADGARLPIFDRIFTRIGASDNLARGRSTFMVEMTETAVILNTAGPNSLIILDEIGRGTATFDGLAIAWAVVEHLHDRPEAKALFATHYHELTELADHLSGVKNYHVSVKESGSDIVFLRRVEPGSADRSYGIEVARLAGLPMEVIRRAREVLNYHERSEHRLTDTLSPGSEPLEAMQFTLFTPAHQPVIAQLASANLDEMKPIDALNLLADLKKQIEGKED
ncbi:MAG: DNA mismatch repair protein MutS [Acidobacteria bacterium]|nr:DNA mismatch repair protein MutS [Acidobacteriota bacterium]